GSAMASLVMLIGSYLASGVFSALACTVPPKWFRIQPRHGWKIAAAVFGALTGVLLTPYSVITFGWLGASSGAYVGELFRSSQVGHSVMAILVPITVAFGTSIFAVIFATIASGSVAAAQMIARMRR